MQATQGEGLSAYELQRLANVERNENALRALGIVPLASPQRAASGPSHTAAKKRARDKSADTGPTRHSKRVQESAPVVYDEDAIYRKLLEEANAAPLRRVYQRQSRPVAGFSRGGGGSSSDENIFEDEVEPGEYAEEDAQIRALVREHGMDWQPDSVLGVPLHKSRRSSSGYAGVWRSAYPYHPHGSTVFYAFSTRGSTAGQKEQLGAFPSAVEAAVAVSRHMRSVLAKAGYPSDLSHPCYHVPAEAQGVKLFRSHRSATGYEGVRVWRPASSHPVRSRVRYRAVAPQSRGVSKTIGYFDSLEEAAVAYAKFVESPAAYAIWAATRKQQPLDAIAQSASSSAAAASGREEDEGGAEHDADEGEGEVHAEKDMAVGKRKKAAPRALRSHASSLRSEPNADKVAKDVGHHVGAQPRSDPAAACGELKSLPESSKSIADVLIARNAAATSATGLKSAAPMKVCPSCELSSANRKAKCDGCGHCFYTANGCDRRAKAYSSHPKASTAKATATASPARAETVSTRTRQAAGVSSAAMVDDEILSAYEEEDEEQEDEQQEQQGRTAKATDSLIKAAISNPHAAMVQRFRVQADDRKAEKARKKKKKRHPTKATASARAPDAAAPKAKRSGNMAKSSQRKAGKDSTGGVALANVGVSASEATTALVATPRQWAGICQKTPGCIRAHKHGGRCKVGQVEEEDYEVECIRDERQGADGHAQFLIKWKGWPEEDSTWEAEATLAGCPLILKAWKKLQAQPASKARS